MTSPLITSTGWGVATQVIVDETMAAGAVRIADGKIYAHSIEALQEAVKKETEAYVVVRTTPPFLMHRVTGETVELPEPPEGHRCGHCGRWHP